VNSFICVIVCYSRRKCNDFSHILMAFSRFFEVPCYTMVKFFILQLIFMILTTLINTFSFRIINPVEGMRRIRIPGKKIILDWIKDDPLVLYPKEYLAFLDTIRNTVNPQGESGKVVYYPGIGPHGEYLDLILPLIATDCDLVVSGDMGRDIYTGEEINLANFQSWVRFSLRALIDSGIVPDEEIEFQQEGDKYSFSFSFGGRERKVIIYYNKDAGEFFPQELESGFDVLMTRWIKLGFVVNKETCDKWLQCMRKPGFVITTASDEGYLSGKFRDLVVPPDFWTRFSLISSESMACAPRTMFFLRGED